MAGYSTDFNYAAHLPAMKTGGLQQLLDTVIAQNDITIMGDQHFYSSSKYADLFDKHTMAQFADAGITDIHIEMSPIFSPLKDSYLNSDITLDEYADQCMQLAESEGLAMTGADGDQELMRKIFMEAGEAAYHAQAQGIDLHFNQVDLTDENYDELFEIMDNNELIREGLNAAYEEQIAVIDGFLTEVGIATDERESFAQYLRDNKELLATDADNAMFDARFDSILNESQKDVLQSYMSTLRFNSETDMGLSLTLLDRLIEIRIDADQELSERIDQTLDGGKAIVIHGYAHGGHNTNDLDDLLANAGHTVGRINLLYGQDNMDALQEAMDMGYVNDPSDIFYNPQNDSIELIDMGNDGLVNGGPHIRYKSPDAQYNVSALEF